MCGSMADIQSAAAEIRRGKEEEEEERKNKPQHGNTYGLPIPQGDHKKLEASGYISVAESLGMSSTTFTQCALKATEVAEITQKNKKRPLRRSRSFKVTDFDTNRKLIYDYL